jgi:HlyD family secretion protein
MKHNHPPIPVIVILVLAVLVGGYFGIRALLNPGSTVLSASGTIEAVEVNISPEIGGKVADVSVAEGARVKAGDVLFRLDDTLLRAQRSVSEASLELARAAVTTANSALGTAQANYDLALNAARFEAVTTRTFDWDAANPEGYGLPGGYFSRADEIAAAQSEVNNARVTSLAAQNTLMTLMRDPTNKAFVEAEKRLAYARAASIVAQDVLKRANLGNNTDLRKTAQTASDAAKTELEGAQAAYDALKDSTAARNIITARSDQSIAQERLQSAQDRLLALQTGDDSPKVAVAQAVLNQAKAASDQAALTVTQAETNLALIDTQIAKLTISAPTDGTILTSTIQPGEIVSPGASVITLGRLGNLTIIVYVPENLYGSIFLGQSATMTVDSFPGETFIAIVSHIADQAEFTPRNVQTMEGRTSTMFAIKLQIQDPGSKLKPGMPADVVFGK